MRNANVIIESLQNKVESLERKVNNLEKALRNETSMVLDKSTYTETRVHGYDIYGWDYYHHRMAIREVLDKILEHVGLELKYVPPVRADAVLAKKK